MLSKHYLLLLVTIFLSLNLASAEIQTEYGDNSIEIDIPQDTLQERPELLAGESIEGWYEIEFSANQEFEAEKTSITIEETSDEETDLETYSTAKITGENLTGVQLYIDAEIPHEWLHERELLISDNHADIAFYEVSNDWNLISTETTRSNTDEHVGIRPDRRNTIELYEDMEIAIAGDHEGIDFGTFAVGPENNCEEIGENDPIPSGWEEIEVPCHVHREADRIEDRLENRLDSIDEQLSSDEIEEFRELKEEKLDNYRLYDAELIVADAVEKAEESRKEERLEDSRERLEESFEDLVERIDELEDQEVNIEEETESELEEIENRIDEMNDTDEANEIMERIRDLRDTVTDYREEHREIEREQQRTERYEQRFREVEDRITQREQEGFEITEDIREKKNDIEQKIETGEASREDIDQLQEMVREVEEQQQEILQFRQQIEQLEQQRERRIENLPEELQEEIEYERPEEIQNMIDDLEERIEDEEIGRNMIRNEIRNIQEEKRETDEFKRLREAERVYSTIERLRTDEEIELEEDHEERLDNAEQLLVEEQNISEAAEIIEEVQQEVEIQKVREFVMELLEDEDIRQLIRDVIAEVMPGIGR